MAQRTPTTFAKRQREIEQKRRAEEKRKRRADRKAAGPTPDVPHEEWRPFTDE